jgi:hypothetical protein
MNQNYNRIPCFVEKNSKQQLKSVVYQKQICDFLLQSPYNSSHSPKIVSNHLPFPQIFPLWAIPSHIIMIQNQ